MTDLELLTAWGDGDRRAGDELIGRHFDSVYRILRTKVADGLDDLVQRVFLACLEARHSFRGDSSFKAFLLGIARIQLYLYYRTQRRHPAPFDIDDVSVEQLVPSPSQVVAEHEEEVLLLAALRRIPVPLQLALELYYWESLKLHEIAQVLDIPSGTVKSRLHRAREAVRVELEALTNDADLRKQTLDNFERWATSIKKAVDPPKG